MAVISKVGFTRLLGTVKQKSRYIEETCPRCGEHLSITMPKRAQGKKGDSANEAVVLSKSNGNSLIELKLGRRPRRGGSLLRLLHLTWQDKTGSKETLIPVPRTKRQFGHDCPDNIDDCEQMRRWTLGWPKEAIAVMET